MKFLVSFCNNNHDLRTMYGVIDVEFGNDAIANISFGGFPLQALDDLAGTTGIAAWNDEIYLALQGSRHSIAVLGRDLQLKRTVTVRNLVDPHGIAIHEGTLYAVSTGSNCIVRAALPDLARTELVYGEETPLDTEHLNDLCLRDGSIIACKFGPRRRNGGRMGSVFDATANRTLFDGVAQPHSVTCFEHDLYLIESASGSVLHLNEAAGPKTLFTLTGYGRGLAVTDRCVLVGRSDRRTVGRFGGRAASYHLAGEGEQGGGSAGVFVYDKATGRSHFIDLSRLCCEIYQIFRIG